MVSLMPALRVRRSQIDRRERLRARPADGRQAADVARRDAMEVLVAVRDPHALARRQLMPKS
jgi:hypothetical protein